MCVERRGLIYGPRDMKFWGKDCVLCVKYIVLTQQQFQESRNEIPEIAAPSIFRILKLLFLAHFQE